jgi:ABC-type polysaccharide/polyol phosphate transport system ATPase subunit
VSAVEFEHVSKSYPIYEKPSDRLRELLTFGVRSFHRDFKALQDVSFSIPRGEVFCIVGENGSGKSTALQIVAGILTPSAGGVQVNGRVAALLELGAGFNTEFTGRDNVYLNGSIMGLSKREMDQRYRQIEEFAEIGKFIDQPLKTYSSGMVVRLAFAVAIHLDPEVLIVDEALAVGDTYFRHRCMRKVHELRARDVTIIFVSHSAADIQAIGDRVLWLEHGRAVATGAADEILPRYLAAMSEKEGRYQPPAAAPVAAAIPVASSVRVPAKEFKVTHSIPNIDQRHGDGRAEILGIAILNEYDEPVHLMMPGSRTIIRVSARANDPLMRPVVGFLIRNHLGCDFAETSTAAEGQNLKSMRAGETCTIDFELDLPEFYPAAFSFSPSISDREQVCDWIDNAITVQMGRGEGQVYGCVQIPVRIEMAAHA